MIKLDTQTRRSKRLRKKLRLDEFQELGFELEINLNVDLNSELTDAFFDRFLAGLIGPNGMGYCGWDYGYVCSYSRECLSEKHRELVSIWLKEAPEVATFTVHPLADSWHSWNGPQ